VNQPDPLRALDAVIASASPADRAALIVGLAARLATLGAGMVQTTPQAAGADRNLDVHEAAARLGMSAAWLYRHGADFPCSVRIGRRLLFSERGLETFLARRRSA